MWYHIMAEDLQTGAKFHVKHLKSYKLACQFADNLQKVAGKYFHHTVEWIDQDKEGRPIIHKYFA